jgi:hypothetical protein
MIRSVLIAATALAASSGLAMAQSPLSENPPTQRVICIDVGGQNLPAVCKAPASRIDQRPDICSCPQGTMVDAPICAAGVKPPIETLKFERARKLAARDGSLIGDLYQGQPMCVSPRFP